MQIVTGYEGVDHVTAWQDRDLNQGMFGTDTYILETGSQMSASIVTNNEIDIADGALVMQGCQGVIQLGTFDAMTIANGSQGMLRHDLIVAEYKKTNSVESMTLKVIKGTASASNPSDPSYTSGNIQNGDSQVQVPIYRVVLDGISVSSVELMVPVVPSLSATKNKLSDMIIIDNVTDTVDFAANENKTVVLNASKAGYIPIGIASYTTGSHYVYAYGFWINGSDVNFYMQNTAGALTNRSIRVTCLYLKA